MSGSVQLTPENARDAAAEAVESLRQSFKTALDYSPESLLLADRFLEEVHRSGRRSQDLPGFVCIFGCYLGEVLVRSLGGAWLDAREAGFGLTSYPIVLGLPGGDVCNPLGKVAKRLDNGPEDSLASFFNALKARVKGNASAGIGAEGAGSGDTPRTPPATEVAMDWPTRPDDGGHAPSLIEVMGRQGPESAQAAYLLSATASLKSSGWEPVEYQTVGRCPVGYFTIPCVAKRGDRYVLIFSHAGAWEGPDYARFDRWNLMVRACDQTKGVPIVIVHDEDPARLRDEDPARLREEGIADERFGIALERVAWANP
jgi:hypothetical protein